MARWKIENYQNRSEFDLDERDQTEGPPDFSHLWVLCENCYGQNYKSFFLEKLNICEYCGDHLEMNSSERIEVLVDPNTWVPMHEGLVSMDFLAFLDSDSEEYQEEKEEKEEVEEEEEKGDEKKNEDKKIEEEKGEKEEEKDDEKKKEKVDSPEKPQR